MDKLLQIINTIRDNKGLKELTGMEESAHLMNDLGFDSLDLAELTVRCEQVFQIDIFEDGIVTTVKEVLEKLNA
ncbi:MAG: phosphopantetheine-binding protein [Pseudomonadota bacterium]|nr:phosphopantetheine-binding protein [Pseudomonadota bacterium]